MYEFVPSPNNSPRPQGVTPSGIVMHFTAGGSTDSTVRWFANQVQAPNSMTSGVVIVGDRKFYNSKASAHYVCGRDGQIINMVPECMSAWHSGSSSTVPMLNGKSNINAWTIGIEMCNWGPLVKRDEKFFTEDGNWVGEYVGPDPISKPTFYQCAKTYSDSNGLLFPDGMVEYWEPYPDVQMVAVTTLVSDLMQRYNITKDWVKGHEHIDPSRKCDPGPAFDWNVLFGT